MAEAVEVGVLPGVFDAVMVAVGSGVFVVVADGVRVEVNVIEGAAVDVGVKDAVEVLVGGSPVKVKDPEDFHSLPAKI